MRSQTLLDKGPGFVRGEVIALFGLVAVPSIFQDAIIGSGGAGYALSQSTSAVAGDWGVLNDASGTTGAATNSATDQWIQADFGVAVPVVSVRVGGGTLTGPGAIATHLNGCVIQSSTDGSTWTDRATVSGVADSGGSQFVTFSFSSVTARYWRLFRSGSGRSATTMLRFNA